MKFPLSPAARWRVRVCVSFYHESSASSPSGQFPRFHFYRNKVQFLPKVSQPPWPSPPGVPRTAATPPLSSESQPLARIPGSTQYSPRDPRLALVPLAPALWWDPVAGTSAPPPLPDAWAAGGSTASAHRRARPAIGSPGCPSPPLAPFAPVGRFCWRSRSPGGSGAAREDSGA